MDVGEDFLEKINNLDESIKKHVEKMGFPYPLVFHVDKTQKMDVEINRLLM